MPLCGMHTSNLSLKHLYLETVQSYVFFQVFKLTHKCACPNACVISPSGHSTKGPTTLTVPTRKHSSKDPTSTATATEKHPSKDPTATDSPSKLNVFSMSF